MNRPRSISKSAVWTGLRFLDSLAGCEVDPKHGLYELKQAMRQKHEVSWELDLLSDEEMVNFARANWYVDSTRVRALVKIEEVSVDDRVSEHWVVEKISEEKWDKEYAVT